MKIPILLLVLLFATAAAVYGQPRSVYTSIAQDKCKKVRTSGDGILYRAECKGVAGYKVSSLASDHRDSIELISPSGATIPVNLWQNFSAAPGSLGTTIEWRVRARGRTVTPYALIVRVNQQSDPDNRDRVESRLAVIKLLEGAACVTDLVPPEKRNQNAEARTLADTSEDRECRNVSSL